MNLLEHNRPVLMVKMDFLPFGTEATEELAFRLDMFAGGLLAEVLRLELSAAGLLGKADELNSFSLAHGFSAFEVTNIFEAANLVLSVLERRWLKNFSRLFQYDHNEQVWRSFYPKPGQEMRFEALLAEIETNRARHQAAFWALQNLLPSKDEPGQQ